MGGILLLSYTLLSRRSWGGGKDDMPVVVCLFVFLFYSKGRDNVVVCAHHGCRMMMTPSFNRRENQAKRLRGRTFTF